MKTYSSKGKNNHVSILIQYLFVYIFLFCFLPLLTIEMSMHFSRQEDEVNSILFVVVIRMFLYKLNDKFIGN